ncbi:MAG: alpha/beta hydrolase [Candidatus Vecturithrix sp.]|jgi:pimeloyl-ACP methyl ester carboxylesterase|nr:alpha/beta hydrolase [Candidatus Vecturithrix sp.]
MRKIIQVITTIEDWFIYGGLFLIILAIAGCGASLSNKDTHWVGVQRLEYVSQGTGSPTVVFNSNTEMDSWVKVLPEVARFTSVFADNRPGRGSSKPAMGQNTGKRVVERLHRLLEETGQQPPYVLVGHSYSGLFTNLFARTYPDEVAGVVFVDASHPDQEDWWHTHRPLESIIVNEMAKATYNWEFFDFERVAEDIRAAGPFPDIPVIVITAGQKWILDTQAWRDQWLRFQQDLVALSPQGRQIIATKSGHVIQDQQPEVVIDAIRAIVAQASTAFRK